ncbi:MAG TPA: hypothetical protein VHI52_23325, partial [Verrucomicrobiae bacterium]|nr:hypothetical protein [Verrucomicrobiae bacterium]
MNTLRGSGFTTVVLWCIHVDASTGNLILNDQLVVANGAYVGNSTWPGQLASLKVGPTSVNRVEVSVGSWGVNDFQSIQSLMSSQGSGTNSILYRNFKALKTATGADAIDFDDETLYDVGTTVQFGQMLAALGFKVTLCPYTNPAFWQNVRSQLGSVVDAVYLQCYAGGAGNSPASWNSYFGGLKVSPGMWCAHGTGCAEGDSPASVAAAMAGWKISAGIPGGFMWLYDDMLSCSGQGKPSDYAAAINQAIDPLGISPSAGFSAVASGIRFLPASTAFVLTNTGATAIGWSLRNTTSWLRASATNGSIAAHSSTSVNVALDSSVATNLVPALYSASIWFTNLNSKVSWSRGFMLDNSVTNWPLVLTGFNADLLARQTATPSSPGATAFDIPNNYCFYQAGLAGSTRGLPVDGSFPSLCDKGTAFQMGAYGGLDALLLGNTRPSSGTLTLAHPEAFDSIAVLACSANGGGVGSMVLNFQDGSRSQSIGFNAQDWFYTTTNVALQGFGRLKLGTTFTVEDNGDSNPNLY